MQSVKTVAALHDLSGVGRCALTVVIPVISAMGVQVCPAPTAVLSAHTAFPDFVSLDLTDYLEKNLEKWVEMGLQFDCVYTGYLASVRQEEIAGRFMRAQKKAMRVVDPVMGDDGEMYRALPADMPSAMRKLCKNADIITPNMTEVALLTDTPYPHGAISHAQLLEKLNRLMDLSPKTALITGVQVENVYANAWMGADGKMHAIEYAPVPAGFPGTGDLFASVLAGALTKGDSLEQAVKLSTEYVKKTMLATLECGTDPLYGVQLEKTLCDLEAKI